MTMIVFSVFFGRFAKIGPSDGFPYPVFAFAALLPWQLFAGVCVERIREQPGRKPGNRSTKVYFPRLFFPAAATGSFLVDFVISLAVSGHLMAYYAFYPHAAVLVAWCRSLSSPSPRPLAVGLWLSA